MTDPLALARQQLQTARAQAVALIASIDASLMSLPQAQEEEKQPRERLAYLGAEDEG